MKVTEEEIRPEKVFNEYLELTAIDTVTFFSNADSFEISCPLFLKEKILHFNSETLYN